MSKKLSKFRLCVYLLVLRIQFTATQVVLDICADADLGSECKLTCTTPDDLQLISFFKLPDLINAQGGCFASGGGCFVSDNSKYNMIQNGNVTQFIIHSHTKLETGTWRCDYGGTTKDRILKWAKLPTTISTSTGISANTVVVKTASIPVTVGVGCLYSETAPTVIIQYLPGTDSSVMTCAKSATNCSDPDLSAYDCSKTITGGSATCSDTVYTMQLKVSVENTRNTFQQPLFTPYTIKFDWSGSSCYDTRIVYTEAVLNSENVIMTDISSDVLKITTFEIARTFKTSLSFTVSDYMFYSSSFNSSEINLYNLSTQFLNPVLSGLSSLPFSSTLERPLITTLTILSSALLSDLRTAENTAHFLNLSTNSSDISATVEIANVTQESIEYLTHSSDLSISSDADLSIITSTKRPLIFVNEINSSFKNVPFSAIMQPTIAFDEIISSIINNQSKLVPSSTLLESSTFKLGMLSTIINSAPSTMFYQTSINRNSDLFKDTFTSEFRSVSCNISSIATSPEKNISVSTNRESLQIHFEMSFKSNSIFVSSTIFRPTITQTTEQTSFSSMTESSFFSVKESHGIWNLQLTISGSSLFLQPSYFVSNAFRSPSTLFSVEDKSRLSLVLSTSQIQHVTLSSQVLLSTKGSDFSATTQHTAARAEGLSSDNIIIISSSIVGGLVVILVIIVITLYVYNNLQRKQSNKNNDNQVNNENVSDPSTFQGSDYPYMYTGIPRRFNYKLNIPYSYEYYCDYERNWKNA